MPATSDCQLYDGRKISMNCRDLLVVATARTLHAERPYHGTAGGFRERGGFFAELNHRVECEPARCLMRDEQNGRAALELIHRTRKLLAGIGIECAGGL